MTVRCRADRAPLEDLRMLLTKAGVPIENDLMKLAEIADAERAAAIQKLVAERDRSRRKLASPGRNHPCPCGSGRKWKRCCGVESKAA